MIILRLVCDSMIISRLVCDSRIIRWLVYDGNLVIVSPGQSCKALTLGAGQWHVQTSEKL